MQIHNKTGKHSMECKCLTSVITDHPMNHTTWYMSSSQAFIATLHHLVITDQNCSY